MSMTSKRVYPNGTSSPSSRVAFNRYRACCFCCFLLFGTPKTREMVVVVILVFEDDDDDDKVDDGEDPSFPKHAFVLAFPFAFPFRPDEDLLCVQRKENAGEEVTESKARIFMSSGRSKVQTVFFFRARANGLTTRLRPLEGKTFRASNASHEQTTRLIKARVFRERRRRRRSCAQNTRTNFI